MLNPAFADRRRSASFGRLFFNVIRNDAPRSCKDVFKAGRLPVHPPDELLVPFGNTPLGNDTTQSNFCGQAS